MSDSSSGFVEIAWRGPRVRIEHAWIARGKRAAPQIVFPSRPHRDQGDAVIAATQSFLQIHHA